MAYVIECIYTLHLEDMRLVAAEIGVSLDGCRHLLQFGTLLQFYVHHAAVNALTHGNGHAECILDTLLGADTHAVSHGTAGAEIGVTDALRGEALHERTYDAV